MEKENLDNGIKPDVNESLALSGLFRKVSVKERLPNWSKYFGKTLPTITFSNSPSFMVIGENEPSGILEKRIKGSFNYWLEEVEFPTQDEIENERTGRNYQTFQFDLGASWMKGFVLAGKAVTAKDNVR